MNAYVLSLLTVHTSLLERMIAEAWHPCRSLPMTLAGIFLGNFFLPPDSLTDISRSLLVNTHISKELAKLVRTVNYFAVLAQQLQSVNADFRQIQQYIRKWLSDMRCFDMSSDLLAASNILNIISNFSQWIVCSVIHYDRVSRDIRGDLVWLKKKWRKGDWNLSDPLRGIHVAYREGRIGRSLNKDWEFYNPDWNCFGDNGLISGESWPYQIAIMRDGGHGSPEAGISGVIGQGATSIVLSNPENRDEYADWDMGDRIGYVSTASINGSPTRCTEFLLDSHEWFVSSRIKKEPQTECQDVDIKKEIEKEKDDRPVRVFRSWRLPPKNQWRPENGFRYDGLYDVVDQELLDEERALYRFKMERRPNQGLIRVDQPDNQTLLLWYQCAAVQRAARSD